MNPRPTGCGESATIVWPGRGSMERVSSMRCAALGDIEAQHEQLAVNAGCAPSSARPAGDPRAASPIPSKSRCDASGPQSRVSPRRKGFRQPDHSRRADRGSPARARGFGHARPAIAIATSIHVPALTLRILSAFPRCTLVHRPTLLRASAI